MDTILTVIDRFSKDKHWMRSVQEYSGLHEHKFSELIACFFLERDKTDYDIPLPEWAATLHDEALLEKQKKIIANNNWDSDMSILGIIHLFYIAYSQYKVPLHKVFLKNLEKLSVKNTNSTIEILDFGCGASSFSQLALSYPNVTCSVADVDKKTLQFLFYYFQKKWPNRTKIVEIETTDSAVSKRSRVHINVKAIKGKYDIIVLADVLEHTLDPLGILLYFISIVNRNGFFFVNYPKNIEGDWHTPEAFWMRKWCMFFLYSTCKRRDTFVWYKRVTPIAKLLHIVFQFIHPLLLWKSKKFTYNYFSHNSKAVIDTVAKKAKRDITKQDLLQSVYH